MDTEDAGLPRLDEYLPLKQDRFMDVSLHLALLPNLAVGFRRIGANRLTGNATSFRPTPLRRLHGTPRIRSQRRRIQCPTDDYQFVYPRFTWLPWLSRAPVERHVDSMENEPPRLAFQVDSALDPQQVLALSLYKLIDPPREPRLVHPARFANGDTHPISASCSWATSFSSCGSSFSALRKSKAPTSRTCCRSTSH
jgi:hypothetical protein